MDNADHGQHLNYCSCGYLYVLKSEATLGSYVEKPSHLLSPSPLVVSAMILPVLVKGSNGETTGPGRNQLAEDELQRCLAKGDHSFKRKSTFKRTLMPLPLHLQCGIKVTVAAPIKALPS